MNMKNLLLASVALVLVTLTPAIASTPIDHAGTASVSPNHITLQLLADSDGEGGGDSGGGGDDGADHDSNDDHGGSANDNDDNDADEDRNDDKSGGRKPRIPGGSGCDSAQDRAEHPECNAG
jgi:hypothetical protein